MDPRVAIANVLMSLAAQAQSEGLPGLEKCIAAAAAMALLEIPGAADLSALKRLAGTTVSYSALQ